jgi:glyoxylase-like metal-dependent hydrolase (beta-lactamase superfamily II)
MQISLIEIKQEMPGFNRFINAWICLDHIHAVIDVGPARSVDQLIHALDSWGVSRVDYVFLTHIHIDHAGGLAAFLDHFPSAKVICHKKAFRFLTDPSPLWAGSRSVLGEIAMAYGEPRPVSEKRLIPHTGCPLDDLKVLETPGHALHHLSFSFKNNLFVGEASGNYLKINNGAYLRPATPPKFYYDTYMKSLDRLLALPDQPIHFGHFGEAESSRQLLKMHHDQMIRWKRIIHEHMKQNEESVVDRALKALMLEDPMLAVFSEMSSDVQEREKFFMRNSIKGFVGYLK